MKTGVIKRGLNLDDDDDVRKPDEYQKLDADRKKTNFQKDLDSMLFGGGFGAPRPRPPKKVAEQPKPAPVAPPKQVPVPPKEVVVVPPPVVVKPEPKKPVQNKGKPTKSDSNADSIPDKKPVPVEPKLPPPSQPVVQPTRYDQPEVSDRLYPYPNKNNFNRPAYVRKLKKVAEDFKFHEENGTLHFAYDTVRPVETDRTRQRKHNAFNFSDFIFPANSSSLGEQHKSTASTWKKPSEFAKSVGFGKYVDPNDLRPGSFSSPHFLSTLSGLSEFQFNIKRLIEDQKVNANGFYLIRLFVNSVWRYIPVDSLLPFIQNENLGVLSNADAEFQLSSALIEKAYAKIFGGYDTFERFQPRQYYLRDLTGAPVTKYSSDNYDLSNIIKKAITAGKVILAVPNERIVSLGLNPNYSYNVINYTSKGTLELRNSWGTLEERPKITFKPEGTFELSSAQVRDNLSHIIVAHLNPAYYTTTVQSRHKFGFYSSYNFKVSQQAHGYLTISQWDERLFPTAAGYAYSPFHIVLHKVESKEKSVLVNSAFSAHSRNLDLEVNLTAGSYVIFIAANWLQKEHSYNLSFYGTEKVQFERVYTEKIPQLVSQGFETLNFESGRRTQLSKTIAQYFHYHAESNLVLLTVENTTDRETTTTVDMSRVKLDQLVLLTSHNNQENYSNKIGSEIEEYKGLPIADRRWSLLLRPREKHTWIFAAEDPYHPENPRKWGFN